MPTSPRIPRSPWLWAWSVTLLPLSLLAEDSASPDIRPLVDQLTSPNFAIRQQATSDLEKLGPRAIPLLAEAAAASDSEVRIRATNILLSSRISSSLESRQSVRRALSELTASDDPIKRDRAKATLARVNQAAAITAAAELTRLGAILSPIPGGSAGAYSVQIGAKWTGGSEPLSLLSELVDVPWLSLENSPLDDEALPHIARLGESGKGPTRLYLDSSRIVGAQLKLLAPLHRLIHLSLRQLPITDQHLAELPPFAELQNLGLDGTRITDAGLLHVSRYSHLQMIWLNDTQVTDQGLTHLQPLNELRTLQLPGTRCSGPGLTILAQLPSLTYLSLRGVSLQPNSLKHIAAIRQLEQLGLDQTNVADDQLKHLTGLAKLRTLWLSGTPVGDPGLEHLRSLRALTTLHLSETQVTPEGTSELQRSLPQCHITTSNRPYPGSAENTAARNTPPRARP